MKLLILPLLLISSLSYGQVNIEAPTAYDSGMPLSPGNINSYEFCISNVVEDICTSTRTVPGTATTLDNIPGDTRSVKARTILEQGRAGDFGPRFYEAFHSPLAPGLSYSITLTVGQQ